MSTEVEPQTVKLFVGGLAWATTEESLRRSFEKYGTIERTSVIRDRDSGRSRGFGFVTFTRVSDAEAAIEGLNNTEIDGRPVRVDMASDKDMKRDGPPRMGGGGRGGRPMGGRPRRDDRDAPRGGRDDYDGSWNDRHSGDGGRGNSGGYGRNRERSPGGGDRFRRPSGDGRDRSFGDGGRRGNGGGRDYEGGRGGRDFKPRGGSGGGGGDDAGWGAGEEGGNVASGGW